MNVTTPCRALMALAVAAVLATTGASVVVLNAEGPDGPGARVVTGDCPDTSNWEPGSGCPSPTPGP